MEEENIRTAIAQNIAFYRRQAGHTQAELAGLINYSDKSISKWERGEGVPDIYVLARIAALYGVTVNDLIAQAPPPIPKKPHRLLTVFLSLGLAWLVATTAFFALMLLCPSLPRLWMCFIYALPVCGILLTVFSSLWSGTWQQALSVALLIWTLALSVHLTVMLPHIQWIYAVAGVLQLLFVLWFVLLGKRRRERRTDG